MSDWYGMGRWGPPVPPWTRFQLGRGRGWLLLILLVAIVCLGYSWVRPATLFLVDLEPLYSVAVDKATRGIADARLYSIQITRFRDDEQDADDGQDELRIFFLFCSPSEASWDLRLFYSGLKDERPSRYFPPTNNPPENCEAQALSSPWLSPQQAIQCAREEGSLPRKQLREGPAFMALKRRPDGRAVWAMYYVGDQTTWVYVDATTGALVEPPGE
jgi:hypothetical protein